MHYISSFKCILGINSFPPNKFFFYYFIHFIRNQNNILPNNGILLNDVLRSKLLNNHFPSCSFINPDFLLTLTVHFDNKK